MIRLVVGLGNPGLKYRHTPHNVGYEAVEILAERHGGDFRENRRFRAALAHVEIGDCPVLLAEPLTYMNLSGEAVAPLARYHNIAPAEIFVICDDVNLTMGRVRIRAGGSHGGQKGLLSIIQSLGTNAIPRLRIGIDPGEPIRDLTEYVLTPWWGETRESMRIVCDRAADAAERAIAANLKHVMTEYNGRDFFQPQGPSAEC